MRTSNKTQVYIVRPMKAAVIYTPRLIRGTLKEVESKLRGEVEITVATAEQAHSMADTTIEDAGGEPV